MEGAAVEDRVREGMERTDKHEEELQRQGAMLRDLVGAVAELRHLAGAILVAILHRASLRVRSAIWDFVGGFA